MSTRTDGGLRSDASRNYDRILDAAARAFEQHGATVSLDEIAARAGVGVATLYRRFRTREELIAAVAEHVFAADVATAVVEGGRDPWADLVATLNATLAAYAAHPVLVELARESPVFDLSAKQDYIAAVERVLGRARDAGAIRPELTVRDVAAIMAMALTMVRNRGRDEARRYLALLIDGIRPTGHRLPEAAPRVEKRRSQG
jgi:AcrR family transcriptional regulator